MIEKKISLTDSEKFYLLKKGFTLAEIIAFQYGYGNPDAVSEQSYDKKSLPEGDDENES